jgi:phosphatidylinositol alpha-mannosyltransferase
MTDGSFRSDGPMSLALVHPFSWPDVRRGGERYLDDLAWYLATRGHHVSIITGTAGQSRVERRPDGVLVHRLHHPLARRLERVNVSRVDAFGVAALPTLLRNRYHAVHALTPSAALAARLVKQPTVYTVLGHPTPDQVGLRRMDTPLMRAALRRANRSVALSQASAAATFRLFGVQPGILPPGVRLKAFEPVGALITDSPVVLFCSDASDPRKGIELVLRAFQLLLEIRPEARLHVAGPGDHRWALAALGRDAANLESSIDVLGAGELGDVPRRYQRATVTVLPSRHEAFGLVLVESLASGTPVVCTADGGMPEIVTDDLVGRVAPPNDPPALAAALDEVIALSSDLSTADRCRTHARRWGWMETVGPMHEDLYRGLSRRAGRRGVG